MKKVTIKDIAKRAGVANSTVTNALNPNSKKISIQKRNEILNIVEEMNYIPMQSAQQLSQKNKISIGLFLRTAGHFNNSIIDQELIFYLNKFAHDGDLDIITIITSYDQKKSYVEIAQKLQKHNFSHIIIQGLDKDLDILSKIIGLPTKKFLIELPFANKDTVFISTNNFEAQSKLTELILKENNISKVLYITGNTNAYVSVERLKGFEETIKRYNIDYEIIKGHFDKDIVSKILQDIDFSQYDYISCASDVIAAIVAQHCLDNNIKDKIISGFDGADFLSYFPLKLYTIKQDISLLSLEIINMIKNDKFESKLLDFKIIKYDK